MNRNHSLRRYDVLEALQQDERLTLREIAERTGARAVSQIYALVYELEKEHLVERGKGARNLRLTEKGKTWVRTVPPKERKRRTSRARTNWENGHVAMPRLSKAEQARRIEQVVQKAQRAATAPAPGINPWVLDDRRLVEHERIGACKVG